MPSDTERRKAIVATAAPTTPTSVSMTLDLRITVGPGDAVYIRTPGVSDSVNSVDDMEAMLQLNIMMRQLRRLQKRRAAHYERPPA